MSNIPFPRNKNVTLFSVEILNENRMTPDFNLDLIETSKILYLLLFYNESFCRVSHSKYSLFLLLIFFTLTI